jgi:hypothetical protein
VDPKILFTLDLLSSFTPKSTMRSRSTISDKGQFLYAFIHSHNDFKSKDGNEAHHADKTYEKKREVGRHDRRLGLR